MRTPGSLGDLLPIAVPGFLVIGALSTLIIPTVVGALAYSGPLTPLVLGLITGTLVFGYLLATVQEAIARRGGAWALPPGSHLADREATIVVPNAAVRRAGFEPIDNDAIEVPIATAYALERSLSGEWGTPEGAGWDRVAFLQRLTLGFATASLLGLAFLVVAVATENLTRGIREHATPVFVLGGLVAWALGRVVAHARRESVLDLLADARALLMDRGDVAEVRRVLSELGLELSEESLSASVSR